MAKVEEMDWNKQNEIWTAQDLAAYWRVTDRMITAMANRGEIPGAFRVGNRWRFYRNQIGEVAAQQRSAA